MPMLSTSSIKRENEKAAAEAAEPPRKKLRWKYTPYHAVESKDMEPLTAEKAKHKAGWVVTPLGRVYRPVRLKPTRPLPRPTITTLSNAKGKGKEEEKRKVKKPRARPELRARIRKIDMMNYGSIYLKGKFLDVDVPPGVSGTHVSKDYVAPMEDSSDEGGEVESSEDESETEGGEERELATGREEDEDGVVQVQAEVVTEIVSQTASLPIPPLQPSTAQQSASLTVNFDLEKRHSLDVLASIFGTSASIADGSDEDDWIGRESVGSDVDEANLISDYPSHPGEGDNDFEVVPRKNEKKKRRERTAGDESLEGADSGMAVDGGSGEVGEPVVEKEVVRTSPKPQKEPQLKGSTKLKDLFAPSEAEGM